MRLSRFHHIALKGVFVGNSSIRPFTESYIRMSQRHDHRNFAFADLRFYGVTFIGGSAPRGLSIGEMRSWGSFNDLADGHGNFKRRIIR